MVMATLGVMADTPTALRGFVEEMPQECKAWRKFGLGLTAFGAVFAFMMWSTVRSHPEQDLPLWPAWIFAAVAGVGVVLTAATVLHLPPFRSSPSQRNTSEA